MAGQGLLSMGITLSHSPDGTQWTVIPDLQEVPELGGTPEKVEITTLADGSKRYIQGIKDYGDLSFTFLYDNSGANSSFRMLQTLEAGGQIHKFKVTLPDETEFVFDASVATKLNSAGVNAPITFAADLSLNSEITITHPTGA